MIIVLNFLPSSLLSDNCSKSCGSRRFNCRCFVLVPRSKNRDPSEHFVDFFLIDFSSNLQDEGYSAVSLRICVFLVNHVPLKAYRQELKLQDLDFF